MAEIFWSAQNSDPKRKFRFQLLVDRIPVWVIKTVSKPAVTVNPVVHQYLNHEFRYPGRVTWDSPINVTLVDPLDPDLARTTLNMIRNAGYRYPLDPNQAKTTMTKADATKALGRVAIQQIDGEGNPVEEWVLRNAFVLPQQLLSHCHLHYQRNARWPGDLLRQSSSTPQQGQHE